MSACFNRPMPVPLILIKIKAIDKYQTKQEHINSYVRGIIIKIQVALEIWVESGLLDEFNKPHRLNLFHLKFYPIARCA